MILQKQQRTALLFILVGQIIIYIYENDPQVQHHSILCSNAPDTFIAGSKLAAMARP